MKNILFIIGLFLSVNSFGQTSVSVKIFDKDSVFITYPAESQEGDEVIIRATFTYTYPQDANNPFLIKIGNYVAFDGTLQDWLDTGFSIHTILPLLAPNTSGPPANKYAYPVSLNGVDKTYIRIMPKVTTSIINPLEEKDIKISYYTIQGLKVEKPIEGLYIWKAENGESGKLIYRID